MSTSYKVNEEVVRAFKKINLVSEEGSSLVDSREALHMAEQQGQDLVLVSVNPMPVCKIFNYQKFVYGLKKKKIAKVPGVSSIRFGMVTDVHDYQVKSKKVLELLEKGHKVAVILRCRGEREVAHIETMGLKMMERMVEELRAFCRVEQPAKVEGKMVKCLLGPLPKRG